ncbi:hypothetical protein AB833_14685 [Chromatiales bacterium (ex Bugula neritina AB1)]|nr:hypothetical protein AB833_14685 [Chromatiales bacterium (ex Bugula neritina AB1)]
MVNFLHLRRAVSGVALLRNNRSSATCMVALLSIIFLSGCGGDSNSGQLFEETPKSVGFGGLPSVEFSDPNFLGDHFSGSGSCAVCHNDMTDDTGKDVSIESSWEATTMAQSARDPYWRAKAAATIHNHPNLKHEVNDTCTRCHAPMANEAARKSGETLEIFTESFTTENKYYDHAMDGVSCTLCHQIEDTGSLGTTESGSGNFSIAEFPASDKENRPAYGQYADPVGAYMIANSDFTPAYGAHMSSSAMCATCHELKTHSLDAEGNVIPAELKDRFQEQQTFTEWNNSDYRDGGSNAASCQDCHMPKIETTVTLASSGTDLRRSDFREHTFLGANTVMLDMFENFKQELGIQAEGFPEAIQRNRQFLKTAAELQLVGTRSEGDHIIATLKIDNKTGHKLPSGYPSRRVFVHLAVTDTSGALIFESGKINPDGSIVGVDSDTNFNRYEPHYNSISNESQVLVFEAIMADANGDVTHSLVEANRYAKDNRLTPKGFDKTLVDNDVAVIGAAANDDNFNAGSDLFEYRIPVNAEGNYYIVADLIYQPLAFGHLESLFQHTEVPEVDEFKTIYDATKLRSEIISSAISQHTHHQPDPL